MLEVKKVLQIFISGSPMAGTAASAKGEDCFSNLGCVLCLLPENVTQIVNRYSTELLEKDSNC